MRTFPQLLAVGISVLAFVGAPAHSLAQQTSAIPNVRSFVQIIRLKPDMVNEWIDLQKSAVIPAQKKAGVKSRTTLVTQVGNAFEYQIITPFPEWAAFDSDAPLVKALGADGAAQLNAKLRRSILTQSSYMTNRVDSLTIPAGDALVWRIATRRALPGKVPDYIAYYRADVLPGLRKAKADGKIAGATIAIRGVGAPSGEIAAVTYYSKFADIDGGDPLVLALGREAADAINAKGAQFSTPTQVIVRRRLPDLSF
jgi:hypothetical protein